MDRPTEPLRHLVTVSAAAAILLVALATRLHAAGSLGIDFDEGDDLNGVQQGFWIGNTTASFVALSVLWMVLAVGLQAVVGIGVARVLERPGMRFTAFAGSPRSTSSSCSGSWAQTTTRRPVSTFRYFLIRGDPFLYSVSAAVNIVRVVALVVVVAWFLRGRSGVERVAFA
jgi:hypothetical protein